MPLPRGLLALVRCAGMVSAGALLSTVLLHCASGESQLHLSPAYFDLKALERATRPPQRRWVEGLDAKDSLRLVIRPGRCGPSGLKVDVEVWNLSNRPRRVFYVNPLDYPLLFQDNAGQTLNLYRQPLLEPATRLESGLPLIGRANCLGATYLLPDFYERTREGTSSVFPPFTVVEASRVSSA
jgi:hypothetical protein